MTFVQSLGPKAFRRPLDTAEVTDLMAVYTNGAMMDYATGISLMVQALITSPSFVYRTELGPKTLTADASGNYPDTTLNPYEVASQLGFLFLGSLPDAALTAAAADGSLATTAGVTDPDRSPAGAARRQDAPDEHPHRLVQRPADVRQGEQGHRRCSRRWPRPTAIRPRSRPTSTPRRSSS